MLIPPLLWLRDPALYDSLLAKLICWGNDRAEAIARAERALQECVISGIKTTVPFHQAILRDPLFRSGELSTVHPAIPGTDPTAERMISRERGIQTVHVPYSTFRVLSSTRN